MAPALMHMQWQYNMLRSHFLFPSLDIWPVRLSHPHAVDQTTRVHSFSYVSCVALKTCIPFITTRARRTHTEHTLNTQYTCAWVLTEVDGTHKMLCCALTALSITIVYISIVRFFYSVAFLYLVNQSMLRVVARSSAMHRVRTCAQILSIKTR